MAATFKSNDLVRYTLSGLNAKVVAQTEIFTTETGRTFITEKIIVYTSLASSLTLTPTFSIGSVGAGSYNNILNTAGVGSSLTTGTYSTFVPDQGAEAIGSNTPVKINITAGTTGTTHIIQVDIIGYYIS